MRVQGAYQALPAGISGGGPAGRAPGAGSNTVYNIFKACIMGVPTSAPTSAQINLTGDTLKLMLMQSSYTVSPDHDFVADVVASELGVTGYTGGFGGAGRKSVITSRTLLANDSSDLATFDAADPSTWTALGAGQTIGGAILIKELTSDALSPLICYFALTNTPTNGGDISLTFNAAGILTLT